MSPRARRMPRREFLGLASRTGLAFGALGGAVPALLAACGREERRAPAQGEEPRAIVGDVLDFALSSDEWAGAFGFVTFRLHRGLVDGNDVFFIRTDTSDEGLAIGESLVFAPKLAFLTGDGLHGSWYAFENGTTDQSVVLSSEPDREDYTPAWHVHRATWNATPRTLTSARAVERAERAGELSVEATGTILNAPVVKWSAGVLPTDGELKEYLGGGQLVEAPDTSAMKVTFKLHECFPGVRYIVVDTSLAPMAEGMHIAHSPLLAGSSAAGATGRTNVFMNGLDGPGPMGFQPSVFDSRAGTPEWSPYWDHMTYAWKEGTAPRVLRTEDEVHAARDAGELDEFPGTPDTKGEIFTVNCPVPVLAPNTFAA